MFEHICNKTMEEAGQWTWMTVFMFPGPGLALSGLKTLGYFSGAWDTIGAA